MPIVCFLSCYPSWTVSHRNHLANFTQWRILDPVWKEMGHTRGRISPTIPALSIIQDTISCSVDIAQSQTQGPFRPFYIRLTNVIGLSIENQPWEHLYRREHRCFGANNVPLAKNKFSMPWWQHTPLCYRKNAYRRIIDLSKRRIFQNFVTLAPHDSVPTYRSTPSLNCCTRHHYLLLRTNY